MINIPVEIGDIILTGRFKNIQTKVKEIGKDEHGMPTINGKKVVTFRIKKDVPKEKKMSEIKLRQLIKEIKPSNRDDLIEREIIRHILTMVAEYCREYKTAGAKVNTRVVLNVIEDALKKNINKLVF